MPLEPPGWFLALQWTKLYISGASKVYKAKDRGQALKLTNALESTGATRTVSPGPGARSHFSLGRQTCLSRKVSS